LRGNLFPHITKWTEGKKQALLKNIFIFYPLIYRNGERLIYRVEVKISSKNFISPLTYRIGARVFDKLNEKLLFYAQKIQPYDFMSEIIWLYFIHNTTMDIPNHNIIFIK